jgi:lysophospholipase L1-like esterase
LLHPYRGANQVVAPYHARVIVLYCGDNDVASGVTPDEVRDGFIAFVKRVRLTQPDTPIVFLSIKPSSSRAKFWPAAQAANKLVREVCAAQPHLTFVDVATPLLGDDGQPRDELFLPDRLHLNEAGYAVWTRILTPVLESLLAAH